MLEDIKRNTAEKKTHNQNREYNQLIIPDDSALETAVTKGDAIVALRHLEQLQDHPFSQTVNKSSRTLADLALVAGHCELGYLLFSSRIKLSIKHNISRSKSKDIIILYFLVFHNSEKLLTHHLRSLKNQPYADAIKNEYGSALLSLAICKGHYKSFKTLKEIGNLRDNPDNKIEKTAFFYAFHTAQKGCTQFLKTLISDLDLNKRMTLTTEVLNHNLRKENSSVHKIIYGENDEKKSVEQLNYEDNTSIEGWENLLAKGDFIALARRCKTELSQSEASAKILSQVFSDKGKEDLQLLFLLFMSNINEICEDLHARQNKTLFLNLMKIKTIRERFLFHNFRTNNHKTLIDILSRHNYVNRNIWEDIRSRVRSLNKDDKNEALNYFYRSHGLVSTDDLDNCHPRKKENICKKRNRLSLTDIKSEVKYDAKDYLFPRETALPVIKLVLDYTGMDRKKKEKLFRMYPGDLSKIDRYANQTNDNILALFKVLSESIDKFTSSPPPSHTYGFPSSITRDFLNNSPEYKITTCTLLCHFFCDSKLDEVSGDYFYRKNMNEIKTILIGILPIALICEMIVWFIMIVLLIPTPSFPIVVVAIALLLALVCVVDAVLAYMSLRKAKSTKEGLLQINKTELLSTEGQKAFNEITLHHRVNSEHGAFFNSEGNTFFNPEGKTFSELQIFARNKSAEIKATTDADETNQEQKTLVTRSR